MKKALRLFVLSSLVGLTSCNNLDNITLYKNTDAARYKDLIVKIGNSSEVDAGSYVMFSFYVNYVNKNPNPISIKANSEKIYRESDKAVYAPLSNSLTTTGITLECDVERSVYYYVNLPSSTKSETYYFELKLNMVNVTIYFYNR